MAEPTDQFNNRPGNESFRLGRATWLMTALLKQVDQGDAQLPTHLEDSVRFFIDQERKESEG